MPVLKFPKLKLAFIVIPIAAVVSIVIIAVSLRVCIIKVGVDQVGVKTVVWGIKRGIVKKDFQAGWHRNVPGTVQWEIYDSTVQTLEMTEEHAGTFGHDERDALKVRTKDDYDVSADLIIKYRIKRSEAWMLRRDIGSTERYKQIVENEARDIARSVFGRMGELDLYNPYEKRKRALEGRKMHNKRLEKRHVQIIDWLILDIRFDPGLDRKIKSIKVAELEEKVNISKGKAANQRGITQTIDAETEAVALEITGDKKAKIVVMEARTTNKIIEIMAKANQYQVEKRAAGDRYKAEKIASGTYLIAKAKADGEKLRREAMTGIGGNMIVAMEAAKNMNLKDLVISTQDMDFLDINQMIAKFGTDLNAEFGNIEQESVDPNVFSLEDAYEYYLEEEKVRKGPDEDIADKDFKPEMVEENTDADVNTDTEEHPLHDQDSDTKSMEYIP